MPTEHIVALLIQERDKLNRAIAALQEGVKRRGRPPKNPLLGGSSVPTTGKKNGARKKRAWSASRKQEQAKRMKEYWKKKRNQK
jgi:hypothetical protein